VALGWECGSVVEHLPSICKALSPIASTRKNTTNKKNKTQWLEGEKKSVRRKKRKLDKEREYRDKNSCLSPTC
jgi:hypothetical protein